jgi:hypothetical protein
MPKSRGQRRPAKKSLTSKRLPIPAASDEPSQGRYNAGRVRSSMDRIGGLLISELTPPDLMVELLPPMLWLEHAVGHPRNMCVSSCVSLHYAYTALGIEAHPRAVDLVVTNRRTDTRTLYGRPDPYWSEATFHGHCVLWLPGSGRFIDPTVEQYPDVRDYELGPICGRLAASLATPEQQARIARGELIPGTHVGVEREDLLLLYTTVGHEFDEVVMSGAPGSRTSPRPNDPAGTSRRSASPCSASQMSSTALARHPIPESVPCSICSPLPRRLTTTLTTYALSCPEIPIGAEDDSMSWECHISVQGCPRRPPRRTASRCREQPQPAAASYPCRACSTSSIRTKRTHTQRNDVGGACSACSGASVRASFVERRHGGSVSPSWAVLRRNHRPRPLTTPAPRCTRRLPRWGGSWPLR